MSVKVRQHPDLDDGQLLNGPSAAKQLKLDIAHSLCGPSEAKKQKLDLQTARGIPPAYGTSSPGLNPVVMTRQQKKNNMGGVPGLLGCPPPLSMHSLPFSGRYGLLPFPQTGIFPFRVPGNNSWRPARKIGFPSPTGGVLTAKLSASSLVTESQVGSCSSHAACEGPGSVVGVIPPSEIPAQVKIDRIYSELDALDKKMNALRWSVDPEGAYSNRGMQIDELQRERRRLQQQLGSEKERLQVENLHLSKELEKQYNISMGSNLNRLPNFGSRQNEKCTGVPESSKKHHTEDWAAIALSVDFAKLTCQIYDLDWRIEGMLDGQSEDVVSTENEALSIPDQYQTLQVLRNRRKALKKESLAVNRSRQLLLNEASNARFGFDPFPVLKKVAKCVRTWRCCRTSYQDSSKDGPSDDVMIIDSVVNDHDDDVQIVNGSDDSEEDTSNSCFQQQWRKPTHGNRNQQKVRSKEERINRTVREIEGCMKKSGLTTAADNSYFVLSALSSVLLARQKHRKMAEKTQQTCAPSTTVQPCALSRLTAEINQKMNFNIQVANRLKKTTVQETVNMYMNIYNEQK